MFGREMCANLPDLRRKVQIRERHWEKKIKAKNDTDEKRGAKSSGIEPGDWVLLKVEKTNELSPTFRLDSLVVVKKNEGEVSLRNEQGNESFIGKYDTANKNVTPDKES